MNQNSRNEPSRSLLAILASPRKHSNSTAIAESLLRGFEEDSERTGPELQRFLLRELKIGPCLGCDECKKSPETGCVQDDDMQRIYPILERAGTLVLATPVYSFNLSAQIKLFIDRMYALWNEGGPDKLQGKKIVLILTYGDEDVFVSGGVNAIRSVQDLARFYGMEPPEVIHCRAGDEGEAEANAAALEGAARTGRRLARST